MDNLEAVRDRKWKLHVRKMYREVRELYDLQADPGETQNLYDSHPEVAQDLTRKLDACRRDIGDAATNVKGQHVRSIGRVDNPDTLTHFEPDHPYMIAMYDLKDRG